MNDFIFSRNLTVFLFASEILLNQTEKFLNNEVALASDEKQDKKLN